MPLGVGYDFGKDDKKRSLKPPPRNLAGDTTSSKKKSNGELTEAMRRRLRRYQGRSDG